MVYALPSDTVPSSVVFYRGDSASPFRNSLFVASDEGRHLLRVQLDSARPTQVVATERLLQDAVGGVRVVSVGPDTSLYLATSTAVGKLDSPAR